MVYSFEIESNITKTKRFRIKITVFGNWKIIFRYIKRSPKPKKTHPVRLEHRKRNLIFIEHPTVLSAVVLILKIQF